MDILIFSKAERGIEGHLKLILNLLKKEELYAKFSKCEFWLSKVKFLGHMIDSEGIHVDLAKTEVIKDWASLIRSGYQQKDRKPSQNDKTEHGMEKTVQNQGQSPKMSKSESILKNQQSNRSRN
ncbi:hypothetical protein Tco_1152682 [Tanacetum coccineum]